MPEPLEREVVFDIAPALAALQDLDSAFEASAQAAAAAYTEAIASALSTPPEIPPVEVEADASAVTTEIDAAVTATDTVVGIEADASGVTSEIDNAVSAAETEATITGDVSEVQGAIDSLEGQEVEVAVVADADAATQSISEFSGAADQATSSAEGLAGANEHLGVATGLAVGATGGLGSSVQSLAKFAGPAGLAIAGLVGFTELAADKAASAETAQRRLNDAFGESAALVNDIDIAGFTGDIGDLGQAVGSSGKQLRNAAADIGVLGESAGFTSEETAKTSQQILLLASRAVALKPSLGDAGEVAARLTKALASGRDKALIPYGIALDKTAVAAEAQSVALEHGRDAVSVFDKIAAAATVQSEKLGASLGEDIAKGSEDAELQMRSLQLQVGAAFAEIGKPLIAPFIATLDAALPVIEDLGKALGHIAEAVLPVLPPLLGALVPPLELFAKVLDAIPTPVLTMAAAFLVLQKAVAPIQLGIAALAPSLAGLGLAGAAGLAIAGIGALAITLSTLHGSSKDAEQDAKDLETALFGPAGSAEDLAAALGKTNEAFSSYLETASRFGRVSDDITDSLGKLGLTNEDFLKALGGTNEEFEQFSLNVAGAASANDKSIATFLKVISELKDERKALQEGSEARLKYLVSSGQIKQADADQAIEKNRLTKTTVDYIGALTAADKVALANSQTMEEHATAVLDASGAWDALRTAVTLGQDVSAAQFALQIGTDVDTVNAKIQEFAKQIDDFVTAGVAKVPTAATAFDAFASGVKTAFDNVKNAAEEGPKAVKKAQDELLAAMDPQRLIEQLFKNQVAIQNFTANLRTLLREGATSAVDFLISVGPEAGAGLAQSLVDQGPEVAKGVSAMLDSSKGSLDDYKNFLATEAYPEIKQVNIEGAQEATTGYVDNFKLRPGAERELRDTAGVIADDTGVPDAAGAAGGKASEKYKGGLALDTATSAALATAKDQFGPAGTAGVESEAHTGGDRVGREFSTGMSAGIFANQSFVTRAARNAVAQAKLEADAEARNGSPSKLFAEVGRNLALGLAMGMNQTTQAVESASQNLVHAALPSPTLAPKVAAAANVGGEGSVNNSTINFDVTFNVNGAMSTADARAAADTFATEAEVALMRRNVIARVRAV